MKQFLLAIPVLLLSWLALSPAAEKVAQAPPADDVQDIVFLGETRPVLLRLHVRIDGKSVPAAANDFLAYLFTCLDVNGDGVLTIDEVSRAPAIAQILSGNAAQIFGMGGAPAGPSMAELDADNSGLVSPAELSDYYRKKGFAPVQFQADTAAPADPVRMYLGGNTPEPPAEAVGKAIFSLLDINQDGKLSKAELAAAPATLLRLDLDEDEMVTARELTPNVKPPAPGMMASMAAMMSAPAALSRGNHLLMVLPNTGEAPADLARHMQARYGPKTTTLKRQDLGLDEATFAGLDTNRDGVLDAAELSGFVKRRPDLELAVHLGKNGSGCQPMPAPLADKVIEKAGMLTLDLGLTRLDLRTGGGAGADPLGGFVRQQAQGQFRQADKDGNGYLDEKEATASRVFRGMFKAADRDGDGKLYEREALAFIEQLRELQQRAQASCVTVMFTGEGRGLFDLLDTNHDGRLSLREMRGAAGLLETLARADREHLASSDLPRHYQVTVRPGAPAPVNPGASFAAMMMDPGRGDVPAPSAGPVWFRKMDRNRDGDVSAKEFLFAAEVFRQIDTDGDGLISAAEAERYEAHVSRQR